MTPDVLARSLAGAPLFATTSDSARERLIAGARRVTVPKDTVLFAQGDPGNELFLVLTGVLEITRETAGEKLTLALVKAGSATGEMALLDAGPRSATARALEPTEVLGIGQEAFRDAIRAEPELAFELLRSMAQALRRTTQQAAALAHQDVYQRLTGYLHELCGTHGKKDDRGVLLDLPLTEAVIGQSIGADPQGVKMLLDVLLFDKVVLRRDGRLVVPDPDRLLSDDRRSFML